MGTSVSRYHAHDAAMKFSMAYKTMAEREALLARLDRYKKSALELRESERNVVNLKIHAKDNK